MRTITTAAKLNQMIQAHIEARPNETYMWHSDVYLQKADPTGCHWNIEVNCNRDTMSCGAIISIYLDALRARYDIAPDDSTAVPAYTTGAGHDRRASMTPARQSSSAS